MSARTFLLHGLLAGLLAGIAAFVVAYAVGEPSVEAAIAVEEHAPATAPPGDDHDHRHAGEHETGHAVSRTTQATWGLALGTTATGLVLGGLTALVAAVAVGRLGSLRPPGSTALVAGIGFVTVTLVPHLKYPALPPGTADGATVDARTVTFFGFVAFSVTAAVAAAAVTRRLLPRGAYLACMAGAATYVTSVLLAAAVLPAYDVAAGFPAQTLWDFRVASLLTLTTLWCVLGAALTGLVGRTWQQASRAAGRRERAAML